MEFILPDQQPIQRTVGKRKTPPLGRPPSPETRAAMAALAQYRTCAPKGIFIYSSHEEMAGDRERWSVQAMLERAKAR